MQTNDKVLAMVRREIENDPTITNKELIGKAKRLSRAVARLSPRQFHGMYRLRATRAIAGSGNARKAPATRRKAAAAARKAPSVVTSAAAAKAPSGARPAVRAVLIDLATDVAAAADKAAVIGVVASLDRYVDRVLAATE